MSFFSNKNAELENAYAMMEGEMIKTPKALMKGLGVRDVEFKVNSDLSSTQMKQVYDQLLNQRNYNLMQLRDFVARDQQHFFETGEVNLELRRMFNNIDITDSIVISKRIKEVSSRKSIEYSERILWNYFNDIFKVNKHAFCITGSLDQIDSLVLLNLKKAGRDGAVLTEGSSFFPVKLYEKFFDKVAPGNNVIVI